MKKNIPPNEYVTDTMGLVLHLEHRRLPDRVKSIFNAADAGDNLVYIPGIVFSEILYLSEKQRIHTTLSDVNTLLHLPGYKEYAMDFAVNQAGAQITDIPELHDRLIAATAVSLRLPLITNDPVITASHSVETIW